MTSAAPAPATQPVASQHQHPPHSHRTSLVNNPATSVASSHGHSAVSPPSKRDLKSWWKGFKLQSKNQEHHGIAAPSPKTTAKGFPRLQPTRTAPIFSEDMDGLAAHPSLVATMEEEEDKLAKRALHQTGSSMQQFVGPPKWMARALEGVSRTRRAACELGRTWLRARPELTVAEPRPQGIFGVPLRQSITYANVAISLVDEDGKSYIYGYVPIVVAKCGVFLKERATEVEGIFRLNGSEKRIKELKTIFDSPDRYGKGLVWDGYTVHDAANVLRRYLNDLPEPVVPLDLYEKFREPLKGATTTNSAEGPQFVENFDMNAAIRRYQELITELPPLNRQLLLYILDLLAVFAAKSDQNRMTSQNLAAIFQPGMLSHPNHAMAPDEYRLNQSVIIFLIENQDHFLIGMQGTAADEKTVEEVQKGTPALKPPATPTRKPGLHRSASTGSVGGESIAREGSLRRNKSTSSKRSYQSNGGPSPASPALASTTPTSGGLARSNTVPSKKSPALQSGRFPARDGPPLSPLTPIAPVPPPPAVVEEAATPEEAGPSATTSTRPSPSRLGLAIPNAKSHEKLSEPTTPAGTTPVASTPPVTTPSKERKLPILFQRMGSSEGDGRQPNKLKKKRIPGSTNPSAHSSTASLSHAGVSPNAERGNPLEAIPSVTRAEERPPEPTQQETRVPPRSVPTPSDGSDVPGAESHPTSHDNMAAHASHAEPVHSDTLHPNSAAPLKSKRSPPTSLHSSFNESSDLDQVEEPARLPAPAEAPAEAPVPDTPNNEKEKKRRWRLSRKKDDGQPIPPPLASPRPAPLGSNATASASGTSINSAGKLGPSITGGDTSDRATINTAAEPALTEVSSKESGHRDNGKDDGNKLSSWIKNKYREHKENVEQRARNKSPPGRHGGQGLGTSLVLQSSSSLSTRGKSLDLKRVEDENRSVVPPTQLPVTQTMPAQNLQAMLAQQEQQQQQVQQQQQQPQAQQQQTQQAQAPAPAPVQVDPKTTTQQQ
ncbi:hypothetical protein VTJ49DRAFT_4012 [Mycothermus thermophilus]|uniref:Rho-GAP domain-containing protein n=1 Tax=Humicola insolens TaxID=85995 RepID=A0ABR3VN49_HUMIN